MDLNGEFPVSSRLHNAYLRNPVELAAFIQDKIEIEDLIVNIGLRFDYFDAQSSVPTDLRDPANTAKLPTEQAYKPTDSKWQLGPRIGFAFLFQKMGLFMPLMGNSFRYLSIQDCTKILNSRCNRHLYPVFR